MSRPDGAPFWGESVQVSPYAHNVTGSALPFAAGNPDFGTPDHANASSILYRGSLNGSPTSATLVSGDAIQLAGEVPGVNFLLRDDTIVASWVVEVVGGAGSLHLSQSLTNTQTNIVPTPDGLGTIVVDGPGTYTLTSPGVTAPYVLDRVEGAAVGYPIVTIECTSGTVEVQQVKMRLWPPGGPLGGLTGRQADAATSQPALIYRTSDAANGFDEETTDDFDAVWDAAWTAARADAAAIFAVDGTLVTWDQVNNIHGSYSTTIYGGIGVVRATVNLRRLSMWLIRPSAETWTPNPDGVFGVDWIFDPHEVGGDPAANGAWDSLPVMSWETAVINLPHSEEGTPPPGQNNTVGTISVGVGQTPNVLGEQLEFNTVGMFGEGVVVPSWPASDEQRTLPFPNADTVRLTGRHEYLDGDTPAIHGSGASTIFNPTTAAGTAGGLVAAPDGTAVKWHVEFAPFSYWVPGPSLVKPPLRLRQRDDALFFNAPRLRNKAARQSTPRLRSYD